MLYVLCMRRLDRELFPRDPKIEHTLWKDRRGRVSENNMEGCMDGVNQNMGEATGQGEINPQVLNPPRVDLVREVL